MSENKHITLCFVADDYGMSPKGNEAIINLCARDIVHSVTVFASDNYSDLSWKIHKDIAWGAHLYLTDRMSLTTKLKSLTENSKALTKKDIVYGLVSGRISLADIYKEFDTQISLLHRHGLNLKFIDTHQNIHGLPFIFGIVKEVAAKYGLEDQIRPFAQLDFRLKKNVRSVLSNFHAMLVNFRQQSRVLVGCPGYGENMIRSEEALMAWDNFLSAVKGRDYKKIFVPCHPGISPAEVDLYSLPAFFDLLSDHEVNLK